jgi:hypothetical protein
VTKRRDRREGLMLPSLGPDPRKRYTARGKDPDWTPGQTAALIMAVCCCKSRPAYDAMCAVIMGALGHPPHYAEGMNPSPRKHQDTCLRALELRLITHWLGNYNDWTPPAVLAVFPNRDPLPLTWGERVKVIKPYYRRVAEQKSLIPVEAVLYMLRREKDDKVPEYVERVRHNGDIAETFEAGKPPVRQTNFQEFGRLVVRLDAAAGDRPEEQRAVFDLWRLLNG